MSVETSGYSRLKDRNAIIRIAQSGQQSKEFHVASAWTLDQISNGNVRQPGDQSRLSEWKSKRENV